MREIKFRAFDKRINVFHYWDLETQPFDNSFWDIVKQEKLTPDEYIGLSDKNGKEIYEGDVLKVPLYGNSIIVWNESICAFQYAYYAIGKGTEVGGRMTNTLYDCMVADKCEVIGNIHENPELCN